MKDSYKTAVDFVNGTGTGKDGSDLDFYKDNAATIKFSRLISACELSSLTIVSAVEQSTGSELRVNPETGYVFPLATQPIPGVGMMTQAPAVMAPSSKGFEWSPLMTIAILGVLAVAGFLFFQVWSGNQNQLNYYEALLVSGNSTSSLPVIRAQISALQLSQQSLLQEIGSVAALAAGLIVVPKLVFALWSRPKKKELDKAHPPVRLWMQEKFVELRRRYTSGYLLVQFQNQGKDNVGEILPSIAPEVLYSRKALMLTTLRPYLATTLAQLKQVSEAIAEERIEKLAAATVEVARGMSNTRGTGL